MFDIVNSCFLLTFYLIYLTFKILFQVLKLKQQADADAGNSNSPKAAAANTPAVAPSGVAPSHDSVSASNNSKATDKSDQGSAGVKGSANRTPSGKGGNTNNNSRGDSRSGGGFGNSAETRIKANSSEPWGKEKLPPVSEKK